MIEVALFGEDIGHKEVVGALVARVASEEKLATSLKWRSDTGGVPTVLGKLNRYLRDLERQGDPPDLLVVAVDSNCEGHGTRAQWVANLLTKGYPADVSRYSVAERRTGALA